MGEVEVSFQERAERLRSLLSLYCHNPETLASFEEYLKLADWLEAELNSGEQEFVV